MVPSVLALGSSRLDAWQPCAWSVTTCQKLATALATLILLTPCSYSWTANQRPENTPVHSLCGASLMQVVLYSIATKDNLHYTSVFPLTYVSLSPATMAPAHDKNRACKGHCWSSILASIRTHRGPSRVCHLQQTWLGGPCELLKLTIGNNLGFTIWIQDLSPIFFPVSKENLSMYFHGQDSLEWVFGLDQPWLN